MPLITDPIDILLDINGDVTFENGNFVFSRGMQGVVQNIHLALSIAKGEWFANLDEGLPWFANDIVAEQEAILGGKFDQEQTRSSFREVIQKIDNVVEILSISASFNSSIRQLFVSFNVRTEFGDTGLVEFSI